MDGRPMLAGAAEAVKELGAAACGRVGAAAGVRIVYSCLTRRKQEGHRGHREGVRFNLVHAMVGDSAKREIRPWRRRN